MATLERPVSTEAAPGSHEHLLDVTASRGNPIALVRSIWAYRFLIFTLARKDFFVRYRRASLGVLWSVGLPLVQALVLTVVFSVIVKLPAPHHTARSVFIFSAIIAYNFFNAALLQASTAIVDGSGISSRIYFPRAVLPIMAVGANAYTLVASAAVMLAIAAAVGTHMDVHVLMIVPAILLAVVFTVALALVLSALHVYFRDVRYIVQAVLLAIFYVTPIFYALEAPNSGKRITLLEPHGYVRDFLLCNPLTGIVETFRTTVGAADSVWPLAAGITLIWSVVLLIFGLWLQSRWDRNFVDLL